MTRNYTKLIHGAQAIIGILFGLFVAYVAYANSIEGRPDLTPVRLILSVILILYSAMQIWVLIKSKISIIHLFAYPIIYIIFGMFWEYAARGYIKNWPPGTHIEATYQNIVCLLIVCFIMFVGLLTTFKRPANV
jgi:hypothetical protein